MEQLNVDIVYACELQLVEPHDWILDHISEAEDVVDALINLGLHIFMTADLRCLTKTFMRIEVNLKKNKTIALYKFFPELVNKFTNWMEVFGEVCLYGFQFLQEFMTFQ